MRNSSQRLITKNVIDDDLFGAASWRGNALGGFDTSKGHLDTEAQRKRLLVYIEEMVRSAPSWDAEPVQVSPGAAITAAAFVAALPPKGMLPQVAPDGEGDIMLLWRRPPDDCIVTVEPEKLHLVVHPGTASVEHIDAVPFVAGHIPPAILQHIPKQR